MDMGTAGDVAEMSSRAGSSPVSPYQNRRPTEMACTQCHRQKQKCNKEQPCSNCVRRGIPLLCSRPNRQERRPRRQMQTPQPPPPQSTLSARRPVVQEREQHTPHTESGFLAHQHKLGRLFKARGAPSYHGDSYFGHQSAAVMMEAATAELPTGPDIGLSRRSAHTPTQPFRNERGPYAQLWDLIGSLPRQKATVDHLIEKFFKELNLTFDSVHEGTFMIRYNTFWDRKCGSDSLSNVDIRWLALLFIILAFGELLACAQPCSAEAQRECEDTSLHFYWAARKCLVIAPSFFGESADLVRAGILITRYLMFARRVSESWLTVSFAVRMAQGQGMHIDGEKLGLPGKVVETRRRLWSQLYVLDRSIALALGRPYAINDRHCLTKEVRNIWVDNMTNEEARDAQPKPLDDPTPCAFGLFHHRLAEIIGRIQEHFICISSTTSEPSYDEVLRHDQDLLAWKATLPPYFRLEDHDTSLDSLPSYSYLPWHRFYLHTSYHFARITLHRTYLLRPSITDRFEFSRLACISSACADLKLKLTPTFRSATMADRLKTNVAAHTLFNSALILGVVAVKDPHSIRTGAILDDLQAYCAERKADTWVNEFSLAEIKVVELCIARARRIRRGGPASSWQGQVSTADTLLVHKQQDPDLGAMGVDEQMYNDGYQQAQSNAENWALPSVFQDRQLRGEELVSYAEGGLDEGWSASWSSPLENPIYFFPEPTEYRVWEGLVDNLAAGGSLRL